MFADCCAIDQLCDTCLGAIFATLRGVAMCRADTWVSELAIRRRAPWVPWPVESTKVREHAVGRIADLSRDVRLRDLLATELISWAAKQWDAARSIE